MQPAHTIETPPGRDPERYMLFLHGILGSRANLRSIARRFVRDDPSWGAILVDLRMHGESQGVEPPHTVDAAAADLDTLAKVVDAPLRGVLGHSFGGKVGLAWAARQEALDDIWVIDSTPSARPDRQGSEDMLQVLSMLESLPQPFESRDDFIGQVTKKGYPEPIAQWLAMSLEERSDGSYGLVFDFDAIHALLDDYFSQDLWPVIESPPGGARVHLVIGGRSDVFSDEDRTRAEKLAGEGSPVALHVIEEAGHWVHAEAPHELRRLMRES